MDLIYLRISPGVSFEAGYFLKICNTVSEPNQPQHR